MFALLKFAEHRKQLFRLALAQTLARRSIAGFLSGAQCGISRNIGNIRCRSLLYRAGGFRRTGYDIANTLLVQNFLYAFNGISVAIKQLANAAKQINIFRTIIAPAAAALQWA